jgi:hypothetical protein
MPLFTSLVGFWFFSLPFPRPLKLGRGNAAKGSEKRDTLNGPLRLSNPERKVRAQFVFGIGSIAEGNFRGSKGFLTSMDRGLIIWLQNKFLTGWRKKTKKPKTSEKNNKKNQTGKKNQLEFLKTNRFGFISLKPKKPEKTGPNQKQIEQNRKKPEPNQKKPNQTGLNQFLFLNNQIKTNQFEPVPVQFQLFFKKTGLIIFFNKYWTKTKTDRFEPVRFQFFFF